MIDTLGHDPGLKPGYIHLAPNGIVLRASHKREPWVDDFGEWPLAATEGQWLVTDGDASPDKILQLAFRAGWTLRGIAAARYMRIPPREWRGNTTADKVKVQNRIARSLTPAERALFRDIPKSRHGDVLDAVGIARRAQEFVRKGITKHDWIG